MSLNIVLVDFENVQPENLAAVASGTYRLIVFVGASQTKVPFAIVDAVQRLGQKAEYVKISGNGSNALDFHIAYYIGKYSAEHSGSTFHIVSKDAGFDPLITHLKAKNVSVRRIAAMSDLAPAKAAKSDLSKCAQIEARLQQMKAARPRTVKTLSSTVAALFGKSLSEEEVAGLIGELVSNGRVQIDGAKVAYT